MTVPGPATVAEVDGELGVATVMLLVADHSLNPNPDAGVACMEMAEPAGTQTEPDGAVEPLPAGVTAMVTRYCSEKLTDTVPMPVTSTVPEEEAGAYCAPE